MPELVIVAPSNQCLLNGCIVAKGFTNVCKLVAFSSNRTQSQIMAINLAVYNEHQQRHTILPPMKARTGHGVGSDTALLSMAIGEVCGITMTKGQGTLAQFLTGNDILDHDADRPTP